MRVCACTCQTKSPMGLVISELRCCDGHYRLPSSDRRKIVTVYEDAPITASSSPAPANGRAGNWRELYRAALFESDKQQLTSRISEAEKAIIQRGRELFAAHDQSEERDALDDALYALRAMRSCVKLKTTDSEMSA